MRQFKRVLAVIIAAIMMMSLASCSMTPETETDITNDNVEIGLLLSGTKDAIEGEAGYCMAAVNELINAGYGINDEKFKYAENVDTEDAGAIDAAITSLLNHECHLIIADDEAYIEGIRKAAADENNVNVKFLVPNAENEGDNIFGYEADITTAAYLTGIVAGMKAAELQNPKLGFLAEGDKDLTVLNAFAMGAKSVNDAATISVVYGTDAAAAADKLIKDGCVVLASDYEAEAIAAAADEAKIFFCGFGSEIYASHTDSFLCAPVYNFTQIYIDAIKAIVDGKAPAEGAFQGDYKTGATYLADLNENLVAEGSQDAVNKTVKEITGGQLTFTVNATEAFDNVVVVK